MDLIILASGNSSRFKKSGYKNSKYLLPFLGNSVLSYLKRIKGIEKIICVHNESDLNNKDIQLDYLCTNFRIPIELICIKSHKKGPGYSLKLIENYLMDNQSYAITYCDYVSSSFGKELTIAEDIDCSVLTYKGFHPHHIFKENIYGYLKLNKKGLAIDYLEKESFTNNKLEEECSAGLYIFKSGKILKESIKSVFKNIEQYLINDEIYISMLVKSLIEKGKKVNTFKTNYFAQLGTPKDYEDHISWVKNAYELRKKNNEFFNYSVEGVYVMLVSGYGSRFKKEGIIENKSLLKINNISTLENAIKKLPKFSKYIFSVQKNDDKLIYSIKKICLKLNLKPIFVEINMPNEGQADSARKVIDFLYKKNIAVDLPVFIAPCDSVISLSVDELKNILDKKCGCVISKTNPLARLNPKSYSYAEIDQSKDFKFKRIKNISVKKSIEANKEKVFFITGAFFYKSIKDFQYDMDKFYKKIKPHNNEKFLDEFFSYLIKNKTKEVTGLISRIYCSLGTPNEYSIAKYWDTFIMQKISS